jgi:hypothetical protein
MRLFRPTRMAELKLIAASDFRAFPPRLSHQPIFYPVLDLEYARQIARDWNAPDEFSGFVGFVTEFDLHDVFAVQFPVQVAGASRHRELWVPAERLEEFNAAIIGRIRVIEAFPGPSFVGSLDPDSLLPTD